MKSNVRLAYENHYHAMRNHLHYGGYRHMMRIHFDVLAYVGMHVGKWDTTRAEYLAVANAGLSLMHREGKI